MDNETEAAIQRSLDKLVVGRTSLIIAHRLSTIRRATRIHVMEAGRIVESGPHEALVAQGGLHAVLWRVQTGRVEMWRGGSRFGLSVAAPFVWRWNTKMDMTVAAD